MLVSICPVLGMLFVTACNYDAKLRCTEDIAKDNMKNLVKVLDHFKDDTLKYKSASYIITNMTYHHTVGSKSSEDFIARVLGADTVISKKTLNVWWSENGSYDNKEVLYDANVVSSEFLISDIEKAVNVWKQSLWRDSVPFESFCKYILPYRIDNEPLTIGSRDSLYKRYYPLIKDETDVKRAFAKIHNALKRKIHTGKVNYPYTPNAIMMEKMRIGSCLQRSIHEASVMRSLGIPAAVDGVPCWANYGSTGHSWVSLVCNDGTYCMNEMDSYDGEEDSIPHKMTNIDSSIFYVRDTISTDYKYLPLLKKRHSIVRRSTYEFSENDFDDEKVDENTRHFFSNQFMINVSCEYGCNQNLRFQCNSDDSYRYLCTYKTGYGWFPISYSKCRYGECVFKNIGDSILCILATSEENKLVTVGTPFIINNGKVKYLKPNIKMPMVITLDRKYPLIGRFLNNWNEMIGATFEVSNDSNFNRYKTIAEIKRTPIFRNEIGVKEIAFRYIRYRSAYGSKSPLSEIEFYSSPKHEGKVFSKGVKHPERCFDGDTYTMVDKTHSGYTVGLDFGKKVQIDRIVFYPKNDDNFVLPNHTYELFYYDTSCWKSLGKQKSTGFEIQYCNVPDNSLLLLKDLGGGKEERPFTYNNGEVHWW